MEGLRFPAEPDPDVIGVYFTLADGELDVLRRLPTPAGRLGTAAGGALSGQLEASLPAGSQRRMIA